MYVCMCVCMYVCMYVTGFANYPQIVQDYSYVCSHSRTIHDSTSQCKTVAMVSGITVQHLCRVPDGPQHLELLPLQCTVCTPVPCMHVETLYGYFIWSFLSW